MKFINWTTAPFCTYVRLEDTTNGASEEEEINSTRLGDGCYTDVVPGDLRCDDGVVAATNNQHFSSLLF